MSEPTKKITARVANLYNTEAGWGSKSSFKPHAGEFVVYSAAESGKPSRFKIGDGVKLLRELPFQSNKINIFQDSNLNNLNSKEKNHGDIAIIESPIGNTGKISRTAYTWDEDKNDWVAFDGNYSAENVYLEGTVKLSGDYSRIGNITKESNAATRDYEWDGKSIKAFLTDLLSQVLNPSKPKPSVSMTLSNAGSKEVGTTITPSFTVTYDPKKYDYGSVTNRDHNSHTYAAPNNVKITLGDNRELTETMTGDGSNKHTLNITDDSFVVTTSTSYYGSEVNCEYGNGAIPLTNTGDEYPESKVTADTAINRDDTSKITGYREGCFYGTVSTAGFTVNDITNSVIRGLSDKTGKNYASGTYNFTIPVGATAVIVACPKGNTGATKVLNTTVNAEYTTLVGSGNIAKTIQIGGADSTASSVGSYGTDYNVWVFIPTEAFGASADVKLTLGA